MMFSQDGIRANLTVILLKSPGIFFKVDKETGNPGRNDLDTAGQRVPANGPVRQRLIQHRYTTITEAVFARYISAIKDERVAVSIKAPKQFRDRVRCAIRQAPLHQDLLLYRLCNDEASIHRIRLNPNFGDIAPDDHQSPFRYN